MAGQLTITRLFDTNTGSRGSPGSAFGGDAVLAAKFFDGIDEGCNYFEQHFCRSPATIILQFGWGTKANSPFSGLAGSSVTPAGTPPYSDIRTAIINRAVTANAISALPSFPASDPTSGNLNVCSAYYIAVMGGSRFTTPDGYIGFDTGQPWFFTQAGGAGTGYDFVKSVRHEVRENMGGTRVPPVTQPNQTSMNDMLTYSSAGVREWGVGGYLSIDQGTTNDGSWNTTGGGDIGDFAALGAPGGVDACNAFAVQNVLGIFSQRDIDTLDCIGWQYVTGSAPTILSAPVVSGTERVNQLLSSTTGSWTDTPTGYSYQWKRSGSSIGGATSSTYRLVQADLATVIKCSVTATNTSGDSTPSDSNLTGIIAAAPRMQLGH